MREGHPNDEGNLEFTPKAGISQAGIDGLSFEGEHAENALVHPAKRLVAPLRSTLSIELVTPAMLSLWPPVHLYACFLKIPYSIILSTLFCVMVRPSGLTHDCPPCA